MGFSIAAGFAIVAVTILTSATSMVLSLEEAYDQANEGLEDQSQLQVARLATRLTILGYSYNSTAQELTVQTKNNGDETLKVAEVDVLVNGLFKAPLTGRSHVEGNSATDVWGVNEKLNLTVAVVLNPPSLASLKVVAGNGVAAMLQL